jgi:hypothetical protein
LVRFCAGPGVDGIRALRTLLKIALRSLGPRAIEAREEFQTKEDNSMSAYSEKIKRMRETGLYKVADFEGGKEVTHTIDRLLEDQVMFEREMDILCFTDTGRQLQVNVTNGETLIGLFGDDPDKWGGQRVTLYLAPYGKEGKLGIRLKAATGNGPTLPVRSRAAEMDDEIPF